MTAPETDDVAQRIAGIVSATLRSLPPRMAVALWYQTGQPHPDIQLCHESIEHCMEMMRTAATPHAVDTHIARLQRASADSVASNRPDWLHDEVWRPQLGPFFDPGYWSNPADPVILDATAPDPIIMAWANSAFGAVSASLALPESEIAAAHGRATQAIRSTLWRALDLARCTSVELWPPVSFVVSCDDDISDVLTAITMRRSVR
jgi:hypothetical protein